MFVAFFPEVYGSYIQHLVVQGLQHKRFETEIANRPYTLRFSFTGISKSFREKSPLGLGAKRNLLGMKKPSPLLSLLYPKKGKHHLCTTKRHCHATG